MKAKLNSFTAFIIYSAVAVVIFHPVFFGKININSHLLLTFNNIFGQNLPFKDSGWDQLRWFFPYLDFTVSNLKNFQIPFWNPYVFSGNTHMANFQTAVFYPLNLMGIFLSTSAYWNFLRITPHIFGAYFTFIYLGNFQINPIARFFGGLTFGFSLLMVTWGEEISILPHGIIWLPLLLHFMEKYQATLKSYYLGLFSLAFAISVFAGFIQSTIYITLLISAYLLFVLRVKKKSIVFLSIIIGFLIASVQLLPSLELYFLSAREAYSPEKLIQFLNPIQVLVTYLSPDFFGNPATRNFFHPGHSAYYESIYFIGIAAFIFALLSFFQKAKDRYFIFFLLSALIGILLSLNLFFSRLQIYANIPFLSSTVPNRILFIPTFTLSILSAFGADIYLKQKDKSLKKIIAIIFFAYLCLFIILFLNLKFKTFPDIVELQKIKVSLRNLIIPFIVFAVTSLLLTLGNLKRKQKIIALVLVIILASVHSVYASKKFLSFSDKKFLYPDTQLIEFLQNNQEYYRTLNFSQDRLLNNIFVKYRIYTPEGYDPASIKSYLEFMSSQKGQNVKLDRTVAEIGYPKTLENFFSDNSYKNLVNITGVKYIISENYNSPLFETNGYKKVYEESREKGFAVFENLNTTPRAQMLNGSAKIENYEPQKVIIKTESQEDTILILSDNYYPGWKAKIDSTQVPVSKAYNTYRAVRVPKGNHEITFYFESDTYKTGLYLSLVGCVLCLLFFIKISYKEL